MAEAEVVQDDPQTAAGDGVPVQDAQFPEAGPTSGSGQPGGQMGLLMGATVSVSASLGDAQMTVRELLELAPGGVVKLEKKTGETLELLLRGQPFALGRLVVVGDQLGVRIEEILPTPEDDPQE